MAIRITKIQVRRGTLAEFQEVNKIYDVGEPIFITDMEEFKIGNGTTPFNNLKTQTISQVLIDQLQPVLDNISEILNVEGNLGSINNVEDKLAEIEIVSNNINQILEVYEIRNDISSLAPEVQKLVNINTELQKILNVEQHLTQIDNIDQNLGNVNVTGNNIQSIIAVANNIQAIIDSDQILTDTLAAKNKAEEWAENPEDQEVKAGQFSAKHHAIKAIGNLIQSVVFVGNNIVFTKQDGSTLTITDGKLEITPEDAKEIISVAFVGNDIVFTKSDSTTFSLTNAKIELKGDPGDTPYIENGNWFIGGIDTGVKAEGVDGSDGVGIQSVTLHTTVGLVKTYRITFTDSTIFDYTVTDGQDGLDSSHVIFVRADKTPAENGTELKAAYTSAKALTPNGNPLSATNRVTILCNAGNYEFANEADAPVFDTDWIDVVSISGERDVIFGLTSGNTSNYAVYIQSNMICVGIDTKTHRFYVAPGKNSLFVKRCKGGIASFGYGENGVMSGTYEDCIGGSYSFSSECHGSNANYKNCTAGSHSFGYSPTKNNYHLSGNLENCVAAGHSFGYNVFASGTFVRCRATANFAFGVGEGATGVFTECKAAGRAFGCAVGMAKDGTVCSGRFLNCRSESGNSFGYFADATGWFINCWGHVESFGRSANASGAFINCQGGSGCFGSMAGGVASGRFEECESWQNSFGGSGGSLTGQVVRSRINNPANPNFPTPTSGGKIVMSLDGNKNLINVNSFIEKAEADATDHVMALQADGKAVKVPVSSLGGGGDGIEKWVLGNFPNDRIIAGDYYNRADGALGNADSGQSYVSWAGTGQVTDNRGYTTANGIHVVEVPLVDPILPGASSTDVAGRWSRLLEGYTFTDAGLICSGLIIGKDQNNYLRFRATSLAVVIDRVIGGALTLNVANTQFPGLRRSSTIRLQCYVNINSHDSRLLVTVVEKLHNTTVTWNGNADFASLNEMKFAGFFSTDADIPNLGWRLIELS